MTFMCGGLSLEVLLNQPTFRALVQQEYSQKVWPFWGIGTQKIDQMIVKIPVIEHSRKDGVISRKLSSFSNLEVATVNQKNLS